MNPSPPTNARLAAPAHLTAVPEAELRARAERFARRLRADGLDGAFLLHPSSAFWVTGTLSQGWTFVDADGRVWLPLRTSVGRAANESPWPVAAVTHPAELPAALTALGATVGDAIGLELDVVPAADVARLEKAFGLAFRDVSRAIRETRAVKSAYEIEWIERAGKLVSHAMDVTLPPHVKEGVREIDLNAFLEGEMRRAGHQGTLRVRRWNLEMHMGTISAGLSASYPCYFDGPDGLEGLYPAIQQGGGERRIERGVTVLVDFVGAMGGYLADRTRVVCVGEPASEARAAHEFCAEMLEAIVSRLRPGVAPSAIWDDVMALAGKSPFADRFMGFGENQVKFLGHGVGLDLDEFPVIARRFDAPLQPGHVLAVEPKVFLGAAGGVGIENTYVVTESEARNLTPGSEMIRVL
ncbi:MAG: aminopeptidase P family protein [Gemmatimonadetes bacterium]|nr:aminopeptidase P family protein [Gemmatimonadota bacterium]